MTARMAAAAGDSPRRGALDAQHVTAVMSAVQRLVDQARPGWDRQASRLEWCIQQIAEVLEVDIQTVSDLRRLDPYGLCRVVLPVGRDATARFPQRADELDAIEIAYDERQDPPWRLARGTMQPPSHDDDEPDGWVRPHFRDKGGIWYATELTAEVIARAAGDHLPDETFAVEDRIRRRARWGRRTHNHDDLLTHIWSAVSKMTGEHTGGARTGRA